jgi:predicted metalloenzyme YecM
VCYRCGSVSEYKRVLITLVDGGIGYILEESMIGGRPITVVMLDEPIIFESWTIK